MQDQNHPLYSIDRNHIDALLTRHSPTDDDLVDLARLLNRYDGFPGANDLQMDMEKIIKLWGLTKDELNLKTRKLWDEGYRPGSHQDDTVGSGFDTSENTVN